MPCPFCQANVIPSLKIPCLGNHVLAIGKPNPYYKTVDEVFPRLLDRILKVPEARFYTSYGRSKNCLEPDLIADEYLKAHDGTIRNRQTAEDEEKICNLVFHWATNKMVKPSLMLSSFEFSKYIKSKGNDVIYKFLKTNQLLGETDVVAITKNRGVFIIEAKSTYECSKHLERSWRRVADVACHKHSYKT